MDLTSFIVSHRNNALLVGDYGTYRTSLSRRLLTLRRKLGRANPKGKKYVEKAPVTAEEIQSNPEFAHLLILTSERAWAHAMSMKSLHAADTSEQAISGSTRSHVISRLRKAEREASKLVTALEEISNGSERTALEASAYHSLLLGSVEFESQKWESCLRSYSGVYAAYKALSQTAPANQGEPFRELLTSTVEPSIRYAAYKTGQPRTISIPTLAARNADKSSQLVKTSLSTDKTALDTASTGVKQEKEVDTSDAPKTISWRSRKVNIEDANIAQSLALANQGESKLQSALADDSLDSTQKAAAYDDVLNPSQDAVDATKTAIDELTADGVSQGDSRIQSLYITRTAVNYALVGWRVGRNRVLCGREDGAYLDTETITIKPKGSKKEPIVKKEGNTRKLAKLRERVVLYDSTLQSLESIRELPGVAADSSLLEDIDSKKAYFSALRCLTIARSHALLSLPKNALALLARAQSYASKTSPAKSTPTDSPANSEITSTQVQNLQHLLAGLVTHHRALVDLEKINSDSAAAEKSKGTGSLPLVERLDEYPAGGADLTNLVNYPPKVRPIPVKPIFLDLAWNYIDYPGQKNAPAQDAKQLPERPAMGQKVEQEEGGKRGWFGWGR